MLAHSLATIFFFAIGSSVFPTDCSGLKTELPNATYTLVLPNCKPGHTDCGTGCCPFDNAVCCIDSTECCQAGQVCIPTAGICIGMANNNDLNPGLTSTKSTAVINLSTPCPSGTTTCGEDRCCIYPNATCCSDGQHCCPFGYSCDMLREKCVKRSKWQTVLDANDVLKAKSANKKPWKSCPGTSQKCPTHTSCCLNDDETWGCCPKPALYSETKVTGQNCCQSYFGYICCTFPFVCTTMGCM